MMKKAWQLLLILALVTVMIGFGAAFFQSAGTSSRRAAGTSKKGAQVAKVPCKPEAPLRAETGHYLGIIMRHPGVPPFRANLGEFYVPFGGHFPGRAASYYRHNGLTPFIQIDPRKVKVAGIAAGHYDTYLRTYAWDAKRFCSPLIVSFGHEFNGHWYSWGFKNTAPQSFVAAWRHMHDIFARVGATNVIWAWDPDHAAQNPAPWWPGSSYVNWIGIDGYFRKPGQKSFRMLFGNRIAKIRKFSNAPILIAETGAPPSKRRAKQIRILFDGVHSYGLLGLIYFDIQGIQDYRIDHDRAALAVLMEEAPAIAR